MARWWGALGPQRIDGPAAGALDGQGGVHALAQFAAAGAAPYFFHCKPVSMGETSDRLAALCTGWRALPACRSTLQVGAAGGVDALPGVARLFCLLPLCPARGLPARQRDPEGENRHDVDAPAPVGRRPMRADPQRAGVDEQASAHQAARYDGSRMWPLQGSTRHASSSGTPNAAADASLHVQRPSLSLIHI